MMYQELKDKFKQLFNADPALYASPGRVNLIGEHTDYNDGFVLPAAIDKKAVFAIHSNGMNVCRLHAHDLDASYEVDLSQLEVTEEETWANYLIGVIAQFKKVNQEIKGFDCVFSSTVPLGAGLSSSAAIECGLAYALNDLFNHGNDRLTLVKMAQKAEHEYAGVQCGIMDQYASVFGKEGHLIKLDCRSHQHEYIPFDLPDYKLVLVNTMVTHSLASSEYNTRRLECEEGVDVLKKHYPEIKNLRDVSVDMLEKHKDEFQGKVFDRCWYVVNEEVRVESACKDLKNNKPKAFGEKMYATHEGLSKRYEVSCKELDFLVEEAKKNDQVLGARMMGGGFGGCTINLVNDTGVEEFVANIDLAYQAAYQVKPEIYIAQIAEGATKL
ncbi:MAG: galactokinase [Cyclobacteriaceae bacterium]